MAFIDTTARKQAELDRERVMNEVQSISLRSPPHRCDVARATHPLNAIVGYADILSAGAVGEVTPEQSHHLDRIARARGTSLT